MALTNLHVTTFCYSAPGVNTRVLHCKYLTNVFTAKGAVNLCTKFHTQEAEKLKKQREDNRKVYPNGYPKEEDMPDNCKGYLFLKHTKQGFDIKGSK